MRNTEKYGELKEKLEKAGVNLNGEIKDAKSVKLKDKRICITGSFGNVKREDIVKQIEENSGEATSSVSKKTDYLIVGEDAGSKLTKAQELGITIISYDEFLRLI